MNDKWRIGDIANAFHISADTLRYYEKAGLLPVHKNQQNGYRYYQYDDIIQLMDVIFYRNLNLPIKDIHKIVNSMGIAEIREILLENQSIVEEKLAELERLKKKLAVTIRRYEQCSTSPGEFSITAAPPILFRFMALQDNNILEVIHKYQFLHSKWLRDLRYTIQIPQKNILRACGFSTSEMGISITQEEHQALSDVEFFKGFEPLPSGEYLYTMIGTDYRNEKNPILLQAEHWLKQQNRSIAGNLTGCFTAASHSEQIDYYEVWIPII